MVTDGFGFVSLPNADLMLKVFLSPNDFRARFHFLQASDPDSVCEGAFMANPHSSADRGKGADVSQNRFSPMAKSVREQGTAIADPNQKALEQMVQ